MQIVATKALLRSAGTPRAGVRLKTDKGWRTLFERLIDYGEVRSFVDHHRVVWNSSSTHEFEARCSARAPRKGARRTITPYADSSRHRPGRGDHRADRCRSARDEDRGVGAAGGTGSTAAGRRRAGRVRSGVAGGSAAYGGRGRGGARRTW